MSRNLFLATAMKTPFPFVTSTVAINRAQKHEKQKSREARRRHRLEKIGFNEKRNRSHFPASISENPTYQVRRQDDLVYVAVF